MPRRTGQTNARLIMALVVSIYTIWLWADEYCNFYSMNYSKTCLRRPRPKLFFKTDFRVMQVKSEALPGVLGNRGKRVFISGEQGNKGQILMGTGEQRQYLGTGNIRKQIFDFLGTGEQANLFQGNKGTGTAPGRASKVLRSIQQYFRPSLSYHFSLKSLFCLFLSGGLRQVLLCTLISLYVLPRHVFLNLL